MHVVVIKYVGAVQVGHAAYQARGLTKMLTPEPQSKPAAGQQCQRSGQVVGGQEIEAQKMKRLHQVMGPVWVEIKDRVTKIQHQMGCPARKEDAGPHQLVELDGAEEMVQVVVSAWDSGQRRRPKSGQGQDRQERVRFEAAPKRGHGPGLYLTAPGHPDSRTLL